MFLPHETERQTDRQTQTRGATLHLSCASQQPVASVQSRRARLTARLIDAKSQSEKQTHTHTHTHTQIYTETDSWKYPLQYYYSRLLWSGERADDLKELKESHLPKIRGEVRFDSSPNFETECVCVCVCVCVWDEWRCVLSPKKNQTKTTTSAE